MQAKITRRQTDRQKRTDMAMAIANGFAQIDHDLNLDMNDIHLNKFIFLGTVGVCK